MNRIFQQFIEYYALVFGVTAIRFDYEQHKIYKSKIWNIYAVLLCIALLCIMPYAVGVGKTLIENSSNNNALQVADSLNVVFNFGAIMFTMLFRWQREKKLQLIALDLYDIEVKYFDQQLLHDATIERHFNYLLYVKLFVCFTKVILSFGSVFVMMPNVAAADAVVETLLLEFYYMISFSVLYSVMLYYFYLLCHVGKRFEQLNIKLEQMFQQLLLTSQYTTNAAVAASAVVLHEISCIHLRLTNLLLQVNDAYKYQTLAVLFSYALVHMTFGYCFVIVLNGTFNNTTPNIMTWIFSALLIAVLFVDITQLYWICEDITVAYQHTSGILKLSQLLPHGMHYTALERQCEIFCMQLMQRKLNVNIGGNFNLNRRTALAFWVFTLTHVLILMQFNAARSL